jgi:hypothetical protein
MADAAYGAAATRRQFLEANRKLVAKVPGPRENVNHFTKDRFQIDVTAMTCTCPAGQTTAQVARNGYGPTRRGVRHEQVVFHFSAGFAAPVRCAPSAIAPRRGRGGRCSCIRKSSCWRKREPYNVAPTSRTSSAGARLPSIGWPGWSSSGCAKLGIEA